ncbi:N-acetylmuramoyl-L-alanine amidase [Jiella marina]|uniref:N-acetylmuramoyl-L-alanine amidase n=1 Tax=Jiella sp. LLJ827 TaxID=2917712 RepID=UPI002101ADBA|nr:N-acetylmuramoyl-L-alanine amidase [Jiella sp. LLJ827]MCQ0986181.1 N-acetylmuramoyl-L-alanine amidase [Jiella sp. LLJ827]
MTEIQQLASEDGLEVRFKLTGKVDVRTFQLKNPDRIAIDFDNTVPAIEPGSPPENDLVESTRHGLVAADRYRVIFRLKAPASARVEHGSDDGEETVALSIAPVDGAAQNSNAAPQPVAVATSDNSPSVGGAENVKPLLIVIDPGHGGDDNGAVSKSGTHEKDINLENARVLQDVLEDYPNVEVKLTRHGDRFISLDDRAALARRLGADLFLSIHADSIRYKTLRGATVYTLSDEASDELSRQIAASENAADRFAPEGWEANEPEVFDILLDLTRRETVSFSEHFAAALVSDLSRRKIELIKNPKRSAGFRVLKAPDVPSVLIEMGFLSNEEDEKLLKDESWRRQFASAVASAVVGFFRGGKGEELTNRD